MAKLFYILLLVAGCFAAPQKGTKPAGSHESQEESSEEHTGDNDKKSIGDLVAGDKRFSTLAKACLVAGVHDTFTGPGNFTVFAPTNDAFAKISEDALTALFAKPEDLKAVILRHVLPSVIEAEDIPEGKTTITTLGGESMTITKDSKGVTVETSAGTAKVILTDVFTESNGVLHAIDTVV